MPTTTKHVAMDPGALRAHAGRACSLLKALANEDRLLLLCQLASARMNVGELEAATGIRQPTLSQQLAVLRQEGLVGTEKEGKYVYYRLADDDAVRVMRALWEIYCAPRQASEKRRAGEHHESRGHRYRK